MSGAINEKRRRPGLTVLGGALVGLGLVVLGLIFVSPSVLEVFIHSAALTAPVVPASILLLGWVVLSLSFTSEKPLWVWIARFITAAVVLGAGFSLLASMAGMDAEFALSWHLLHEPTGLFALDLFFETSGWFVACAISLLLASFKGRVLALAQIIAGGVLIFVVFNLFGASLESSFNSDPDKLHLASGLLMGLVYSGVAFSVLLERPTDGFLGRIVKGAIASKLLLSMLTVMVFLPIVLALVTALAKEWVPDAKSSMIGLVANVLLLGLVVLFAFAMRALERAHQVAAKANTEQAESEYNLNLAQSYGGVGSWQWDITSDRHVVSEQYRHIYGLDETASVEDSVSAYIHPDDKNLVQQAVARSIESKAHYEMVHRIVRPDGTLRWVEKKGNVLASDDGDTVSMHGTVTDVTDRILADRKLKDATERFERITAKAPGLVFQFAITKKGEVQLPFVSSGVMSVLGIPAETCMAVPGRLLSMVHPDDRAGFYAAIDESHKNLSDYMWVGKAITARGELKWIQINSKPTRQEDGSTVWDGIAIDVTESKFAQAVLEETSSRLDFLLNESPTVVYDCQPEDPYELRYVAPNLERLFGFASDPLIGVPVFGTEHTYPDDAEAIRLHEERFLEFGSSTAEYRIVAPDGSVRWVRDEIRRVTDDNGQTIDVVGAWLEITEQKMAAIQLAESESRYERMAAQAPGLVFQFRVTKDNKASFSYVSPGSSALIEFEPEEIVKHPMVILSMISPEDRRSGIKEMVRSRRTLDDYTWSGRVKLESGRVKWIQIKARPSRAKDGVTVWDGLVTDVTEIEEAKHALARSQERYSDVVNSASEAFITIDEKGEIISANPGAERLFEYSQAELEALNIKALMPDGGAEVYAQHINGDKSSDENNAEGKRVELLGKKSDGSFVPIELAISAFERDGVQFFTGVARDITERRKMEDALMESEARFRVMSESSPVGIGLCDAHGVYVYVNQTYEQITSYHLDDVTSRGWQNAVHEDDRDRVVSEWGEFFSHETSEPYDKNFEIETQWVRQDGTIIWIQMNSSPIISDSKIVNFVTTVQDITGRKRAEVALAESEERFQAMSRAAPLGILLLRADDEFTFVNEQALEICDVTFEELQLDGLRVGIHPLDREEVMAKWFQYKEDQRVGNHRSHYDEHRRIRKDGSVIWVAVSSAPLQTSEGYSGLVIMVEDVTVRKEAEVALLNSEERFRIMSEAAPVGVFLADADGKTLYVNDTWREATGCGERNDYSKVWSEFIHPDDRDDVWKRWEEFAISGDEFDIEHRGVTQAGEEKWLHVKAVKFARESEIEGFIGTVEDTTAHKVAEADLRETEERFRAMSESSPVGIAVTDATGGLAYKNRAFENISAFADSNDTDHGLFENLHPEDADRVLQSWDEFLGEDGLFTTEHRLLYPDDSTAWVFVIAAPMYDEGGGINGYTLLLQDVTDRKQAELDSEQARSDAVEANLAKSEFLSRMSHELRTPMNAIIGFAQLLDMDELTPRQRESVDQILIGGRHLLELINEVLDIARIESGRLSISLEPVLIGSVVTNAIEMLRPMADELQVTLNWNKSTVDADAIFADRQRMSQVMLNLVSNAIKYNHVGGHVDIIVEPYEDESVRITVSDTGIGISDEMLGRLFTPFDRLGADQTDIEGTGLGLALTSRLVSAMGSQMELSSHEGVGTKITMIFPKVETVVPVLEKPQTPVVSEEVYEVSQVLVIEDNEANIRLIEQIFSRQERYNLIVAMTGGLGLELAKKYQPDLIILDVNLPDAVGTSILDALKEDSELASVPVVILSADASKGQMEKFKKAGALAYLTKPVNIGELMSVVSASIEAPRPGFE